MANVEPLRRQDLPELEELVQLYDDTLSFARNASLTANAVTAGHSAELRRFWDDGEIVEILAVVGLFGFLNRWNDSMATDLEEIPAAFAGRTIGRVDWGRGKHRREEETGGSSASPGWGEGVPSI